MSGPKCAKSETSGVLPSLFSTATGSYPQQTSAAIDAKAGGEYRGYYKRGASDPGRWFPRQSMYQGRAGGTHNGIDVYAHYAPMPRETPVLSVTDGYFEPTYDSLSPNKAGNRARIQTTLNKKAVTFIYGHLARFQGGARCVKKGDVIGYAGCSGNADTAGECSTEGNCNITSCHVHLIAAYGTKTVSKTVNGKTKKKTILNDTNPADLLGWTLSFNKGGEAIASADLQNKLENPPETPRENGFLKQTSPEEWRRIKKGRKQARRPLETPFQHHLFDHTRSLIRTHDGYACVVRRLREFEPAPAGKKIKNPVRARVLARALDAYLGSSKAITRILKDIETELVSLNSLNEAAPVGGPINRALLLLHHGLWYAMGGEAMNVALSQRVLSETRSGEAKLSLTKAQRKAYGTPALLECGIGVGGQARLISVDHGQSSHQQSEISLPATENGNTAPEKIGVNSISFGEGSLLHASWPSTLDSDDATTFLQFLMPMKLAFAFSWIAVASVHRNIQRLNGSSLEDKTAAVEDAKNAIASGGFWLNQVEKFLSLEGLDDAQIESRKAALSLLFVSLAQINTTVFKAAVTRSLVTEKSDQIGPNFMFLEVVATLEEPERTEPGEGGEQ